MGKNSKRFMLSRSLFSSGPFLQLNANLRDLYVMACAHADGDGVVDGEFLLRLTKGSELDLKALIACGLLVELDDIRRIEWIKHWIEHNTEGFLDIQEPSEHRPLLVALFESDPSLEPYNFLKQKALPEPNKNETKKVSHQKPGALAAEVKKYCIRVHARLRQGYYENHPEAVAQEMENELYPLLSQDLRDRIEELCEDGDINDINRNINRDAVYINQPELFIFSPNSSEDNELRANINALSMNIQYQEEINKQKINKKAVYINAQRLCQMAEKHCPSIDIPEIPTQRFEDDCRRILEVYSESQIEVALSRAEQSRYLRGFSLSRIVGHTPSGDEVFARILNGEFTDKDADGNLTRQRAEELRRLGGVEHSFVLR